jgi:hypothetical protein
MNNLILALFVLASASVVWISQRNSMQTVRKANHKLNIDLANAGVRRLETATALTNAQETLSARRNELAAMRHEVAKPREAIPSSLVPRLDPAREGLWPVDKPYCYLSKKHLETIGFVPFAQEERLSSEAAILFGMSPAEKSAADSVFQSFLERTRQLHLAHAEPVEPAPGANSGNHREISYRIPALANEFREVRTLLADELRQAIGHSRADLFLKRANSELDQVYGQYGGNSGYTVKFYADRQADGTVEHDLMIERLDRRASNGYRITFPLEPSSVMLKYRHLFGEEPLLQPSVQDRR